MKRRLAALALAMLLCLPLTACQKQQKLYSATWFDLFDTVAVVQGYAASQQDWDRQAAVLYDDLAHYNWLFDIYNHYDDVVNLYDVNAQAAAAPVRVGDELYAFLRWCKDTAYPATDGATNIAAGAVLRLWHDARESDSPAPPAADAIAEALQHINIENLILDDAAQTVCFADPDMTLDVGAVGKGYAVEMAAQAAEARGLRSALISVGGNLRAIGTKPDGSQWSGGVENPWNASDVYTASSSYVSGVNMSDMALVTSGNYQRYYVVDGVRYHHLIDPDTLWPARYFDSVSVLSPDSGAADCLTTGLFCMSLEDGQKLIESLDGVEALWCTPDGEVIQSSGWADHEKK